jgi:hypothetical protein
MPRRVTCQGRQHEEEQILGAPSETASISQRSVFSNIPDSPDSPDRAACCADSMGLGACQVACQVASPRDTPRAKPHHRNANHRPHLGWRRPFRPENALESDPDLTPADRRSGRSHDGPESSRIRRQRRKGAGNSEWQASGYCSEWAARLLRRRGCPAPKVGAKGLGSPLWVPSRVGADAVRLVPASLALVAEPRSASANASRLKSPSACTRSRPPPTVRSGASALVRGFH